jgi:hypothetical protein
MGGSWVGMKEPVLGRSSITLLMVDGVDSGALVYSPCQN